MGLFKKKDRVIDLSERYKKQQARTEEIKAEMRSSPEPTQNSGGTLSFLGGLAGSSSNMVNNDSSGEEYLDVSGDMQDRKRKLAKRLMEMTDKLEEISNQIYHLQQRLEVIEKKMNINRY